MQLLKNKTVVDTSESMDCNTTDIDTVLDLLFTRLNLHSKDVEYKLKGIATEIRDLELEVVKLQSMLDKITSGEKSVLGLRVKTAYNEYFDLGLQTLTEKELETINVKQTINTILNVQIDKARKNLVLLRDLSIGDVINYVKE